MSDFLTILINKVKSEPDRSEPTFAGVYRYFLRLTKGDEASAKDYMEIFMSGRIPPAVIADLETLRATEFIEPQAETTPATAA